MPNISTSINSLDYKSSLNSMNSDSDFHPLQKKILKELGYEKEKAFSELKGDVPSNKIAFHLNKLQEENLILKTKRGYKTTKEGREVLPYFDLDEARHPIVVLDLLIFSDDKVYLLPKKDDPLDPFSGNFRAPSTRISKNNRLKEKAEKVYREEFGEKPDDIYEAAVFDSEVTFLNGSEQHYLLFFFTSEVSNVDDDRMFKISEIENINLLPGLDKVIKKIKWSDGIFMGKWDVEQTKEGFKVKDLTT